MAEASEHQMLEASNSAFDLAALRIQEEDDYTFDARRRAANFLTTSTTTVASILFDKDPFVEEEVIANRMLSSDFLGNSIWDIVNNGQTESSDIHRNAIYEIGIKTNGATLVMNASLNATDTAFQPELFYRHSMPMTAIYCVAYLLVFAVGLVGNFFVIAVVFRSPRMRTVTNFFIVNLAVADILVIIFCLPATLMSNIFVRKYKLCYFLNLPFFNKTEKYL